MAVSAGCDPDIQSEVSAAFAQRQAGSGLGQRQVVV